MPLLSLQEFNYNLTNNKVEDGAVYMADTSFLLRAIEAQNASKTIEGAIRLNLAARRLSLQEAKTVLNWEQVRKLMAEYSLDSADAMILNLALHDKKIKGLLTCDSDFRYVTMKEKDFQIILPENFVDLSANPISLEWRNT